MGHIIERSLQLKLLGGMRIMTERHGNTLEDVDLDFARIVERVGTLGTAAEFDLAVVRKFDDDKLPGEADKPLPGINAGFQSS